LAEGAAAVAVSDGTLGCLWKRCALLALTWSFYVVNSGVWSGLQPVLPVCKAEQHVQLEGQEKNNNNKKIEWFRNLIKADYRCFSHL